MNLKISVITDDGQEWEIDPNLPEPLIFGHQSDDGLNILAHLRKIDNKEN